MTFDDNLFIAFPIGWLLLAVMFVIIGWVIYIPNSAEFNKKRISLLFLPIAGFGALWVLTNLYFHSELLVIFNKKIAIAVALLSNMAGGFIIITFYYLSCILRTKENQPYWTVTKWRVSKISSFFTSCFCLANIFLNTYPGLTIQDVDIISKGDFKLVTNSFSWLFFLLISIPIIPAIINLYKATKIKDLRFLVALYSLAGVVVTYSSAIIFSIIFPFAFNEYRFTWIPPFLAFVPVSLFGYIISGIWLREKDRDRLGYVLIIGYSLALCGLIIYLALVGIKALYLGFPLV